MRRRTRSRGRCSDTSWMEIGTFPVNDDFKAALIPKSHMMTYDAVTAGDPEELVHPKFLFVGGPSDPTNTVNIRHLQRRNIKTKVMNPQLTIVVDVDDRSLLSPSSRFHRGMGGPHVQSGPNFRPGHHVPIELHSAGSVPRTFTPAVDPRATFTTTIGLFVLSVTQMISRQSQGTIKSSWNRCSRQLQICFSWNL